MSSATMSADSPAALRRHYGICRRSPDDRHVCSPRHWRTALKVLRLPATRYLSAWYAIAFGGLVAVGLYLPAYLTGVYHLRDNPARLWTAACLAIGAA